MNKTDALKRAAELRQLANRLHRLEIDCVVKARELEHQASSLSRPEAAIVANASRVTPLKPLPSAALATSSQ